MYTEEFFLYIRTVVAAINLFLRKWQAKKLAMELPSLLSLFNCDMIKSQLNDIKYKLSF